MSVSKFQNSWGLSRAAFCSAVALTILMFGNSAVIAQQNALWDNFHSVQNVAQSAAGSGSANLATQSVRDFGSHAVQNFGSQLNLPQVPIHTDVPGGFQPVFPQTATHPQVTWQNPPQNHQFAPEFHEPAAAHAHQQQAAVATSCGPQGCRSGSCLHCARLRKTGNWQSPGPGADVGLPRRPAVNDYRLRVNDEIEFVFQANRVQSAQQYRLMIGDTVRVVSTADERLNAASQESGISIMSDGTISVDILGPVYAANRTISELQAELNMRYAEHINNPSITITGISTDTRTRDFLNSVDARAGTGGQSRLARVTRDGTLRLPLIGAVRVVGLSLDELEREVNSRFSLQVPGVRVSVVLSQQAPRFIYVLGEVDEPGRFELEGPTTVTQAIALAGGWNNGGKLKEIIVFRRDQDWRLMGLRVNLNRGLNPRTRGPLATDDVWLRDSDVVLIPKRPIVHLADAIELYFTRTLYALFPSELGVFDAQSVNAG